MGGRGWAGWSGVWGEWDNCNSIINKYILKNLFIDFREREEGKERRERQRNINLLLHLFVCSLVGFCTYPDQGSNSQSWLMRMTL